MGKLETITSKKHIPRTLADASPRRKTAKAILKVKLPIVGKPNYSSTPKTVVRTRLASASVPPPRSANDGISSIDKHALIVLRRVDDILPGLKNGVYKVPEKPTSETVLSAVVQPGNSSSPNPSSSVSVSANAQNNLSEARSSRAWCKKGNTPNQRNKHSARTNTEPAPVSGPSQLVDEIRTTIPMAVLEYVNVDLTKAACWVVEPEPPTYNISICSPESLDANDHGEILDGNFDADPVNPQMSGGPHRSTVHDDSVALEGREGGQQNSTVDGEELDVATSMVQLPDITSAFERKQQQPSPIGVDYQPHLSLERGFLDSCHLAPATTMTVPPKVLSEMASVTQTPSPCPPISEFIDDTDPEAADVDSIEVLQSLSERIYSMPKVCPLARISDRNAHARTIAPYALKLNDGEDMFFPYVAALFATGNKIGCLVFGFVESQFLAYSGHFVVEKNRLYDPRSSTPVDAVVFTRNKCREHLSLYDISNAMLSSIEGYHPKSDPVDEGTRRIAVEKFCTAIRHVRLHEKTVQESALNSLKLKLQKLQQTVESAPSPTPRHSVIWPSTASLDENRVQQSFTETNLPISKGSRDRLLKHALPTDTIRKRFSHLASFQHTCAFDSNSLTVHYAALESSGCMTFFRNAYLLGRVGSHHIVGIVEKNAAFFIMATRRVFDRHNSPSIGNRNVVKVSDELYHTLHLPLCVPHPFALAMLECRQILRQPQKYRQEIEALKAGFGSLDDGFGYRNTLISSPTFARSHAAENQKAWLTQMLEINFTDFFRDTLCRFPTSPTNLENPQLYADNVVRLWVQQIERVMEGKAGAKPMTKLTSPTTMTMSELFTMDVSSFTSVFLSLFGMTGDHVFRCVRLGSDGLPLAVCAQAVLADQVGRHIHCYHTKALHLGAVDPTVECHFIPFALVYNKKSNPPLSDRICNEETLYWARSSVERFNGSLKKLFKIQSSVDAVVDLDPIANGSRTLNDGERRSIKESIAMETSGKTLLSGVPSFVRQKRKRSDTCEGQTGAREETKRSTTKS